MWRKNSTIKGIVIVVISLFIGTYIVPICESIDINKRSISYTQIPTHQKSIELIQLQKLTPSIPFPTNLEVGDILFFDIKPFITLFEHNISGFSNDHVIMYLGTDYPSINMFVESIDYTSLDLNLPWNGVQKTAWWIFLLYADLRTITIGKVHASDDQKQQAKQFALSHIGEHYQWSWQDDWRYESWHANPVLTDQSNPFYEKYYYPNDPYSNQWTCAELAWAAYLHQGIELGSEPYHDPDYNNETFFYVGPDTIKNSDNITMVSPLWE